MGGYSHRPQTLPPARSRAAPRRCDVPMRHAPGARLNQCLKSDRRVRAAPKDFRLGVEPSAERSAGGLPPPQVDPALDPTGARRQDQSQPPEWPVRPAPTSECARSTPPRRRRHWTGQHTGVSKVALGNIQRRITSCSPSTATPPRPSVLHRRATDAQGDTERGGHRRRAGPSQRVRPAAPARMAPRPTPSASEPTAR
jgi:hypothetical protein